VTTPFELEVKIATSIIKTNPAERNTVFGMIYGNIRDRSFKSYSTANIAEELLTLMNQTLEEEN